VSPTIHGSPDVARVPLTGYRSAAGSVSSIQLRDNIIAALLTSELLIAPPIEYSTIREFDTVLGMLPVAVHQGEVSLGWSSERSVDAQRLSDDVPPARA
jgi:hypothetical protein